MCPLSSKELQSLADQFGLPWRQISEAQEVLLFNGLTPDEVRVELPRLCSDARSQGGGVKMFRSLLDGLIAVLKSA